MPIDATRLMGLAFAERRVAFDEREALLYALATGMGATAGQTDLAYVYEKRHVLVPTFVNSLAFDDTWIEPAGVPLPMVVHGGLDLTFHAPLRAPGVATIAPRIVGVEDKGAGKGAVILQEQSVSQDGALVCTIASNLFVRGGGGFGGSLGRRVAPRAVPERAPDMTVATPTAQNQALIFRLLGDRNPLHVDPGAARAVGFDRPILHGAATFGVACVTLLRALCDLDPSRLKRLAGRFSAPIYPGETLTFEIWRESGAIAFRARVAERGVVALDGGHAEIAG